MIPKVILDFYKFLSSSAIPVSISEDLRSSILDNYNNDMTLPLQSYKDFFRFIDSKEFRRSYIVSATALYSSYQEIQIWVLLTRYDVLVDAHIELIDSLSCAQKLHMWTAVTILESVQQLTTQNFNRLTHNLHNLKHKADILKFLKMYNSFDPEFLQLADIPGFDLESLQNIWDLFPTDLLIDIPKIKGNLTEYYKAIKFIKDRAGIKQSAQFLNDAFLGGLNYQEAMQLSYIKFTYKFDIETYFKTIATHAKRKDIIQALRGIICEKILDHNFMQHLFITSNPILLAQDISYFANVPANKVALYNAAENVEIMSQILRCLNLQKNPKILVEGDNAISIMACVRIEKDTAQYIAPVLESMFFKDLLSQQTFTKWIDIASNKRKGIFNIIRKIKDLLDLDMFNILLDNYIPVEDLDLQYFIAILIKDNILTTQDLKQLLCAAPILAKAKIDITNVALDRATLKKILFFIDTFREDDAISTIQYFINYVPEEFFQQEALPVEPTEPTQPALPEEAAVVVEDSPSVLENLHEKWNSLTGWYNSHFVSMDTNVDSQNLSAIKMQLMAMDAWSEDYLPYLTKAPVPSIFMKSLIILNQEISESCMVKIYLDYLFILSREDECINFIKTIAFLDKYDWFAATRKILLQNIYPLIRKIENLENLFGIIKEMESFDALNQTTYTELMQNNYTSINGRLFSPLKPKTSSLSEVLDAAHSKFNSDGLGIDLDKKADLSDNFRLFVNIKYSHQYVENDMHDEEYHPFSFAPHENL